MEYFDRILKLVSSQSGFAFHPKCRKLRLVQLCFANDLIVFFKADPVSIGLIEGLMHFKRVSDLTVNASKGAIYFAGISALQ